MTATIGHFLCIDTSGSDAGIAVGGAGIAPRGVDSPALARLERRDSGPPRTEQLADLARRLLAERGLAVADLAAVGAVVGPGSYTGLRSGLAFLRGVAFGGGLPAVAVGSLELLAWRAGQEAGTVAAVRPMARGRLVAGVWEHRDGDLVAVEESRLLEEADLQGFPKAAAARGGEALVLESAAASNDDDPVTQEFCRAAGEQGLPVLRPVGDPLEALAALVAARLAHGRTVPVGELLPVYVGWSAPRPNRDRVVLQGASQ